MVTAEERIKNLESAAAAAAQRLHNIASHMTITDAMSEIREKLDTLHNSRLSLKQILATVRSILNPPED